ncbi:MAG TPA: hypothetical protein VKQ08_12535 [Cyclobacteriaceae bacterium]|nr:hypothetical protein [Cyclobacteriaceae bacterium]
MKTIKLFVKLGIACLALCSYPGLAQQSQDWLLEKMPVDLETEFALSALPPHLRDQSTLYLLDPRKGYYIARQGTNGFSTLVSRTDWEHGEFVQDTYAAISYDAEGTKAYIPVFLDVAEMRASGKYNAVQIRDIIIKRVMDGTYKAPSRTGVSYMLSPLLRTYDENLIVNLVLPHYMFYAPRVNNTDIGGIWDGHGPFAIGVGDVFNKEHATVHVLDKEHAIFNYIIIPAGETEKARIVEQNKDLLRKLAEYKSYLTIKTEQGAANHQH